MGARGYSKFNISENLWAKAESLRETGREELIRINPDYLDHPIQ